jgi:hypothetical protein
MVPSTDLQEDGASNSAQLSQRASPFGVSWYFTAFCGAFAARAGVDAPTIAATPATVPATPAATVNTRRREIPFDSVMARCPALIMNGSTMNSFARHRLDLE